MTRSTGWARSGQPRRPPGRHKDTRSTARSATAAMARETAVVVGAGGISGAWFPRLKEEGVNVLAVVDLREEAARARVEEYGLGAEASSDLDAMLAKHRPDFVVDLTTPEAHCAVTCAALRAGCHVVGEKPMAASMDEARAMVRAAEETGCVYMVSQSRRWNANHDIVRRTVQTGELGALTTVNCDFYLGAHFGGFRDEMPSPLVLDMAIHHFDLARFMSGVDPMA
ncbi:MAG: Gfo/Idh/MocA family oxidoreductase, partial [Armatimonadetes bacterium]|nr:Gfo/Idh/MocA family oxidoreductase [Armatimonadota bacterium]